MRVTLSRCHTGPPHAEARTCPWRRAGARADDPAPCFGPCAESPLVPNTQQRRGRRGPGCLLGDRHPSTNTSDSHSDRLPFLFLSSLFLFFFLFSLLGSGRLLFHKLGTVGHKQIDTYFWRRGDVCGAPTAQMTPLRYLLRRRGRKHTGPGRAQGAPRGAPAAEVVGRQRQRLRAWQLHILVFYSFNIFNTHQQNAFLQKKKKGLKGLMRCHLK